MKLNYLLLLVIVILQTSCNQNIPFNTEYISDGFDFPVGKPNANGYYDAQPFGENNHLGSDWNGKGGGNTDLGDPIYAVANGYVNFADDIKGGWGKVIRITHMVKNGEIYESLYAHCDKILVSEGTYVLKGDQIGTIGTANGKYLAHLHFEIRNKIGMKIGSGYSKETSGYLNPSKFINNNRSH